MMRICESKKILSVVYKSEKNIYEKPLCTILYANKEILKGNFNLSLKKTVVDTCLLPSLLYGCQTWVYTNKIKHKITTCQRAIERSMLKLRRMNKIRCTDIRSKTELTDALEQALKHKWKWVGHLSRYNDKRWTLKSTGWTGPKGKRKVGRPRKRWSNDIVSVTGKGWLKAGKDREKWKSMEVAFTQMGSMSESQKQILTNTNN